MPSQQINSLIEKIGYLQSLYRNKYYITLMNGKMPVEKFYMSQQHFGIAVAYWSQSVLPQLLLSAPAFEQRVVILNNLNDELGISKDGKHDKSKSHVVTFENFMEFIDEFKPTNNLLQYNSTYTKLKDQAHIFNEKLSDSIVNNSWQFNFAMMGMIEYAYHDISEMISEYVKQKFVSCKSNIPHYATHEDIDEKHADDFFDQLDPHFNECYQDILLGMTYGLNLLDSYFESIYFFLPTIIS